MSFKISQSKLFGGGRALKKLFAVCEYESVDMKVQAEGGVSFYLVLADTLPLFLLRNLFGNLLA
jgi:hypothetical protein